VGYNLFLVPIGISFEYDPVGAWVTLEVTMFLVYIGDIAVSFHTALIGPSGELVVNRSQIAWTYANQFLLSDVVSVLPLDYLVLGAPFWAVRWVRVIRLLKLVKLHARLRVLSNTLESGGTFVLSIYFVCFVYLTHFAACLMFYVGRLQLEHDPNARFDNRTWISVFGEAPYNTYDPLLDQPWIE
jgi:hypothetical protein